MSAPGVPPLLNTAANVQNTVVLLAADAVGVVNLLESPQWGLFTLAGAPAFAAAGSGIIQQVLTALGAGGQSVGSVEYSQESRNASAPQEQGSFTTYNKVALPYNGRVTYIIGGTQSQRAAFLAAVQSLQASITLFNLVTPEITYNNCNITHHDYRRTAQNGVSMLAVDIWVEEVRVGGPAAFANTATPAGADQVNGGTVQPVPATVAGAPT
jgi:hypothetical protein